LAPSEQILRRYSTIKIGGSAEKILELKDLSTLPLDLPLPIRVLGNGSNILIDDRGLKGTVVITRDFSNSEPVLLQETESEVLVSVTAGIYLPFLSAWSAKRGLSGCEYMVGIPGTFGGAIAQNAGANEQEIKDILVSAKLFDLKTRQSRDLKAEELHLTYRHSILKDLSNYFVCSAELRLRKKDPAEIQKRMDLNLAYRKQKTPYSKPSLGSIFTRLKEGETWLYPGKLIEDAGLKGERVGGARVSHIHANYIVNEGDATFDDVLQLIEKIEARVFEHSGKRLQREILVWSDR
jgi:UDP-N-acetylmuramate dehydrogenase